MKLIVAYLALFLALNTFADEGPLLKPIRPGNTLALREISDAYLNQRLTKLKNIAKIIRDGLKVGVRYDLDLGAHLRQTVLTLWPVDPRLEQRAEFYEESRRILGELATHEALDAGSRLEYLLVLRLLATKFTPVADDLLVNHWVAVSQDIARALWLAAMKGDEKTYQRLEQNYSQLFVSVGERHLRMEEIIAIIDVFGRQLPDIHLIGNRRVRERLLKLSRTMASQLVSEEVYRIYGKKIHGKTLEKESVRLFLATQKLGQSTMCDYELSKGVTEPSNNHRSAIENNLRDVKQKLMRDQSMAARSYEFRVNPLATPYNRPIPEELAH